MKRLLPGLCLLLLCACAPQLPDPAALTFVTAIPTPDRSSPAALCRLAEDQSGRDWLPVIEALEALRALETLCDDGATIESRLYVAYLGYGTALEQAGNLSAALTAYQQALQVNPLGTEAASRLERLQVATPAPPPGCEPAVVTAALQALPAYRPTAGSFVRLQESSFVLNNARYPVYGVNYYPREYPFGLFLTRTPLPVIEAEFDIIQRSGINTLRIFLRYQDLFICPGNGAVPIAAHFQRLDGILQAAAARGLRVIVVLHHDPDLTLYPLYRQPDHIAEQTRFIVARYRQEPAVLAWDVRDRGDVDYREGAFTPVEVLTWLAQTVRLIRATDPNHPITAGWWQNAEVTAPLVDFVSFQHYGEYEPLRQYIAILRDTVPNKPILLTSIGYSTHLLDEIAQRNLLFQSFEEVSSNRLAGWLIYMAFDYPRTVTCIPPDCPGEERDINRYGIWNTSYFPKLAVDAVQRITGAGNP
ncbi:MAG: glycoside hydrolase family 5 protein [Anaerolineae bacterium]|jgi:hypothetical protein|nr:glycoside hydrolase family 5 protein [Anaerolineae bacterium]